MNTKVYMITGVTSGLGKAITLALAKTGETVIMVARDADRAAQVEKEISSATQNPNLSHPCGIWQRFSVRDTTILMC